MVALQPVNGWLFAPLVLTWFTVWFGLASVTGPRTWFDGSWHALIVAAAIIATGLSALPAVASHEWITCKLRERRGRPPESQEEDRQMSNGAHTNWIALSGAVVAVSVTLITASSGIFSLWTSLMGFILLAFMITFFMQGGTTDTGSLMKSEIFAISTLFFIAPLLEGFFIRIGWDKVNIVAVTQDDTDWMPTTFEDTEEGTDLTISLRDAAFVWFFFLFFALDLMLGSPLQKLGEWNKNKRGMKHKLARLALLVILLVIFLLIGLKADQQATRGPLW
jgi:hypothetical protein